MIASSVVLLSKNIMFECGLPGVCSVIGFFRRRWEILRHVQSLVRRTQWVLRVSTTRVRCEKSIPSAFSIGRPWNVYRCVPRPLVDRQILVEVRYLVNLAHDRSAVLPSLCVHQMLEGLAKVDVVWRFGLLRRFLIAVVPLQKVVGKAMLRSSSLLLRGKRDARWDVGVRCETRRIICSRLRDRGRRSAVR